MGFFNFRKKLNKKNNDKKSKQVYSLDQHVSYQSDIQRHPHQKSYIDPMRPPDSSLMSDIMNELNQSSAFETDVTPSDVTEKNPAVERQQRQQQRQQQSAHDGDFHRTAHKKRPLSFNNNPIKPIIMHKSKSTIVKLNDIPDDEDDDKPILKRHSALEPSRTQHNRLSKNPMNRMKERHRQEVRMSIQQPVKMQPKARMGASPSMPIIYNPDNRVSYQNYSDGIVRSASFATNPFGQQSNYYQQHHQKQQQQQCVQPWSDIVVSKQSQLRYSMVDPRLQASPLSNVHHNRAKMIKSASAITIQEQPNIEARPLVSRRPLYYERKIPPSLLVPPSASSLKCRRISPECCHHTSPPPESSHYQSIDESPPSPTSPTSTKYSFKQHEIKFKLPTKLKRELESMQMRRSTYSVPDLTEFQKQQDDVKRKKTFWQSIEPCRHHHRACMKKSSSDIEQKKHRHCHFTNSHNQLMT